ncbi:MAG TPA: ABC transporter substrate-binding protein [Methylomirabilota bacterium]|jgi:peptide/nickel transport system substrate-binding protein|nr:ABC transporter substrate-binding protein [Methylomirabilota bacterium]
MKRAFVMVLALAILATAAVSAPGQSKDTLTVALVSIIDTLDPHMHFERVGILININMFDSLLHKNAKLEYEPSLATSWKALSDTVWEVKLRKGVKFHNGDTMTAEDVKYSFDRVTEPGKEKKRSPQYGNIRAIKEVRIVNPDTIHIVTDKPFPLLLERLVFFPIVPKQHIEKVGDQAFGESATVGTGPWKLLEYKRGHHIRLEAFDQHWRGKPAFKHLTIRGIPEVATQVAELKTGGVDIIRNVSADLVPDLKAHPQTSISSAPILRTHYVHLDMRTEPFNRKLVRQAANYAIDREAIVQKMMAGLGRVVPTVVHPAVFGYDASVTPYAYDPKKAQALLAQAGYPNGVDITLHSSFVEFRPVFEAITQMLTDVGIRTNARMWDPGPAWNKYFQGEGKATHGYYGSWGYYSVFDADAILHPLYHTEPGGWVGKWYIRVEGLDQLVDQARSTVDQAVRKRTYSQIQRLIKEEAPSIFLFHQFDTLGVSKRVEYQARGDEWLWLFDARPKR